MVHDHFLKLPKTERQAKVKILMQQILSGESGNPGEGEEEAESPGQIRMEEALSPQRATQREVFAQCRPELSNASPSRFWAHLRAKCTGKGCAFPVTPRLARPRLFGAPGWKASGVGLLCAGCAPRRSRLPRLACRSSGAEPLLVFWDFDNKVPQTQLETAVGSLQNLFPDRQLTLHMYASYKTLCFNNFALLRSGQCIDVRASLEDFSERFPHGARLPLASNCSLLVAPGLPQAADCWLVRDAMRAVAPISEQQPKGMVCIISDDSDFRQAMKEIRQSGWQVAVLCHSQSWTLRKRADLWLDWAAFCAAAKSASADPAKSSSLSAAFGAPEALRRMDLAAHAAATRNLRLSRESAKFLHERKYGTRLGLILEMLQLMEPMLRPRRVLVLRFEGEPTMPSASLIFRASQPLSSEGGAYSREFAPGGFSAAGLNNWLQEVPSARVPPLWSRLAAAKEAVEGSQNVSALILCAQSTSTETIPEALAVAGRSLCHGKQVPCLSAVAFGSDFTSERLAALEELCAWSGGLSFNVDEPGMLRAAADGLAAHLFQADARFLERRRYYAQKQELGTCFMDLPRLVKDLEGDATPSRLTPLRRRNLTGLPALLVKASSLPIDCRCLGSMSISSESEGHKPKDTRK
ncbi:unnamed protein product [Effrenium voratum]|nr:unnamed protein product [Effrenium voratum]